eukprot:gene7635-10394_t
MEKSKLVPDPSQYLNNVSQSVNDIFYRQSLNTSKIIVSSITSNRFEYPGLKTMHELAISDSDGIILYFHGKGMVYHRKAHDQRIPEELLLHKIVIDNWRRVLKVFEINPHINKIGFSCNDEGAIWFNYFWLRGSFVSSLKPPKLSTERYYYEHYIAEASINSTYTDCYSLANEAANLSLPYFTGRQAVDTMNELISLSIGSKYS